MVAFCIHYGCNFTDDAEWWGVMCWWRKEWCLVCYCGDKRERIFIALGDVQRTADKSSVLMMHVGRKSKKRERKKEKRNLKKKKKKPSLEK